jgi:hypothetical protein
MRLTSLRLLIPPILSSLTAFQIPTHQPPRCKEGTSPLARISIYLIFAEALTADGTALAVSLPVDPAAC